MQNSRLMDRAGSQRPRTARNRGLPTQPLFSRLTYAYGIVDEIFHSLFRKTLAPVTLRRPQRLNTENKQHLLCNMRILVLELWCLFRESRGRSSSEVRIPQRDLHAANLELHDLFTKLVSKLGFMHGEGEEEKKRGKFHVARKGEKSFLVHPTLRRSGAIIQ